MNSYIWNKYWTFESKVKATVKELSQFIFISFFGMLINVAIAASLVNIVGPVGGLTAKRWASIGALTATATSLIWNFIGYKFLVFKKQITIE
jgi:putative flippase GtrA